MIEFLVIFALAASGSLVRLFAVLTLKLVAPKSQSETIVTGPSRSWSAAMAPPADPILRFGMILAVNGALVLGLVSAFPGALAFERAGLAFALLCAGGIIGEIASAGSAPNHLTTDVDEGETTVPDAALSRRLSLALGVMLNLSLAVLISGRGLVEILPPPAAANHAQELESLIVIAERPYDPLDDRNAPF